MINIDEKISLPRSLSLGAQHVLAMDLYIVPIILAGLLSLTVADTSALIQMTFVVAGLATIIQSRCLLKLPVMQGLVLYTYWCYCGDWPNHGNGGGLWRINSSCIIGSITR